MEEKWEKLIIPALSEYIKIPNQSPNYDKEWETNGLIDKAVDLIVKWIKEQNVEGLQLEVITEKGKTPLIFMDLPATNDVKETVLMYGHLDKQPPLTEDWEEGIGPYTPVIKDGKLYGRGGADDGYSSFASVMTMKWLQDNKIAHGRIITMIEASEESGSPDLPFYIEKLQKRLGDVALIVCLDSGCGNYEQFWLTTSLRGVVSGNLKVSLLKEGVHSGAGTGIIASSFRVVRMLLDRIEDSETGKILLDDLYVEIPKNRIEQTKQSAIYLGDMVFGEINMQSGVKPVITDTTELLLNKNWRPQLAVVGASGFPQVEMAGNVLRRESVFKLSVRIPPGIDGDKAFQSLHKALTENPPYGAHVEFTKEGSASGWQAPEESEWLMKSVQSSSNNFFGKPGALFGEGGTIPFMGLLGKMFPKAQFVITGLLGPKSNAHGPNEFLEIAFAKKLNSCVCQILYDFNYNRTN